MPTAQPTPTAEEALMSATTVAPILPFIARVEVLDDGQWVPEAQGSSVEWLRAAIDEARQVYGRVRLVAQWGDELDERKWLDR